MITAVTEITTPSGTGGLSGFARAHAAVPAICWTVQRADGGLMIVTDRDEPRRAPATGVPGPAVAVAAVSDVRKWAGAAA